MVLWAWGEVMGGGGQRAENTPKLESRGLSRTGSPGYDGVIKPKMLREDKQDGDQGLRKHCEPEWDYIVVTAILHRLHLGLHPRKPSLSLVGLEKVGPIDCCATGRVYEYPKQRDTSNSPHLVARGWVLHLSACQGACNHVSAKGVNGGSQPQARVPGAVKSFTYTISSSP